MPQNPNFKIWDNWGSVPRTIIEKDLETLQRYTDPEEEYNYWLEENDNGEYVRWDALIQLLK